MQTTFDHYAEQYEHVRMERRDGIRQLMLHTDGGPMLSSMSAHRELPAAFDDVANDMDNR